MGKPTIEDLHAIWCKHTTDEFRTWHEAAMRAAFESGRAAAIEGAVECSGCPYEDKNECAPDINCDRLLCDTCVHKNDPACGESQALRGIAHTCSMYSSLEK